MSSKGVKVSVLVTRRAEVILDPDEVQEWLEEHFRGLAVDFYEESLSYASPEEFYNDPGNFMTAPGFVLEMLTDQGKGPAFLRSLDPERGESWMDEDRRQWSPERWSREIGRSLSVPDFQEAKRLYEEWHEEWRKRIDQGPEEETDG